MADELAMDSKALILATLADVYLTSGMIDEAISILKDGLSRNPNYTLGKIILGRAYYLKGDIEEALKILEEIYEQAKESESENLYLGHIHKRLGNYEKAIQFYEATLRINPENKEARQELELLRPKPSLVEIKQEVHVETPKKIETITPEMVAVPKEEIKIGLPVEEFVEKIAPGIEEERKPQIEVKPDVIVERKLEEVTPKQVSGAEEPIEIVPVLPEIGLEPVSEVKEIERPSPLDALNEPMKKLIEIKSVKGAFIISRDGLLIQSYYEGREDIEELCALIAGVFNDAENSFNFLKAGNLEKFIIEKTDETICVITAGESLLCIITKPEAKPGLVFVYARRIIDEIRKILG
ncbi:MAG: tetratricopeptide repeat protein [candidate division WOR-3 bacterium]|nr:tetratricopeptide repeat protein [candidate division WOR-3 bacterium]